MLEFREFLHLYSAPSMQELALYEGAKPLPVKINHLQDRSLQCNNT